jgi:hypothetical protein
MRRRRKEKAGMVAATPAGSASRHSHNDESKYKGGGNMKNLPAHLRVELERLLAGYAWLGLDVNLAAITAPQALVLFLWLSNMGK